MSSSHPSDHQRSSFASFETRERDDDTSIDFSESDNEEMQLPEENKLPENIEKKNSKHSTTNLQKEKENKKKQSKFVGIIKLFQSYQDDGQMIMKGCVQWNPVYDLKDLRLRRGSDPGPLNQNSNNRVPIVRQGPAVLAAAACCSPCGLVCKFFTAEPERYKSFKVLFGFPFGILLAYGLYNLVVKPMSLPKETREFIGALMGLGISTGFALSVSVRCVCFLLIPTFFGKSGRSYIGTFAIAFLIAGPVENIIDNAQDITRSLSCASELVANHTATKWKFRLQPVGNVLKDMQAEGFLLAKIGKKVDKAFGPMKKEIRGPRDEDEDEDEENPKTTTTKVPVNEKEAAEEIENTYKEKLSFRCDDVYKAAMRKCYRWFDSIYNSCMAELPAIVDLLCNIVRLHSLCDLIKILPGMPTVECDSSDMMNDNFGEMYRTSEKSIDSMEGGFDVNIQYKVVHTKEDIDITTAEEMRKGVMHDFGRGRRIVEFFLVLIKRLLGFTFLLVVFGAYKYNKNYCGDLRFDNVYLTSYFRKIDARRKVKGKKTLLPLKKMEKGACVYPLSPKLMKSEKKKLGKGTFLILARALLAGMVFFTDYLLFTAMDIIRRHSRVDYRHYGVNNVNVTVGGTGFMSEIVRLFMKGLNTKHTLDEVSTNAGCLPRPVPLQAKYFVYVFGVYFVVWMLILVEAYGLRLRKLIASFFYRKREKQRILFFYNDMLKKRKHFLKLARRKIKRKAKMVKLGKASGLLYSLMKQFPVVCKCLSLFSAAKRRCLICEEKEQTDFISCDTEGCDFVYCPECWFDVKNRCYACLPQDETLSTDSDDMNAYLTDDD